MGSRSVKWRNYAEGCAYDAPFIFLRVKLPGRESHRLKSSAFHGALLRHEMAQFSEGRAQELRKIMGEMSPYVFEWEASPLDVVRSYKVGAVESSGDEASAEVEYEVIARRDSWGGTIKAVSERMVKAQLRLKRDGDHWKVVDPSFPRVSKTFLSTSYRGIFELRQSWYQNASEAQLLRLRNAIDTILLLDSLK